MSNYTEAETRVYFIYNNRLAKELYKKPWIVYTESLSRRTRRFKANSDKTIPIS